jgi:hypothetical protein
VYRKRGGDAGLVERERLDGTPTDDPRDYDVEHYVRVLRESFASRLARALAPADFEAVFADPDQLALFVPPLEHVRTRLTPLGERVPAVSEPRLTV